MIGLSIQLTPATTARTRPTSQTFPEIMDEANVSLREALGGRKTVIYVYDYGDNWRHKVKFEKVVAIATPIDRTLCIGGENACLPEDAGGAPGYEEFLEALGDPSNPEHEDLKAWIGGSFDPAAFDVADVNERLSRRNTDRQGRCRSDYYGQRAPSFTNSCISLNPPPVFGSLSADHNSAGSRPGRCTYRSRTSRADFDREQHGRNSWFETCSCFVR